MNKDMQNCTASERIDAEAYLKDRDDLHRRSKTYLTEHLSDPEAGEAVFEDLVAALGPVVDFYPTWHPIMTAPQKGVKRPASYVPNIDAYRRADHTILFVGGFVTCPYHETNASELIKSVNAVHGLGAHPLEEPLYASISVPVVVEQYEVEQSPDGTFLPRTALQLFLEKQAYLSKHAEVAETWDNIQDHVLGGPHRGFASPFVDRNTAEQMRKILETLNESGLYGPIIYEPFGVHIEEGNPENA